VKEGKFEEDANSRLRCIAIFLVFNTVLGRIIVTNLSSFF
jgi:hypothetical protein